MKIRVKDEGELGDLMTEDQYQEFLKSIG
jgi:hypothetical protein